MESKGPGKGTRYFKGIEHAQSESQTRPWLDDEFPHRKSIPDIDRRGFLKLMGGTLALAGLTSVGCRNLPETKIVPFVNGPEGANPGEGIPFATIATVGGYATGLLVMTHDGRPTKIEGNPLHPASLGSIDAKTQAQLLGLYDPDRLQTVQYKGDPASWRELLADVRKSMDDLGTAGGSGIAILTETVGSPALAGQMRQFLSKYPNARWTQWEPVNRDNVREGAVLAFGEDVHTYYQYDQADVIVSLDANVVYDGPGAVRASRDISDRHNPAFGAASMSRIYAIETAPSNIGVIADHRARLKPSRYLALATAIAARLGVPGASASGEVIDEKLLSAMVADLQAKAGNCIVVAGEHHSPQVHAMVHAINGHLGNIGRTVIVTEPILPKSSYQQADFEALVGEMKAGAIKLLIIVGGNPVYSAPADLEFGAALEKVGKKVQVSLYSDETGQHCDWQAPLSHSLEAWGDGRAFDGTYSIQQPLILPLYDSKSEIELMEALLGSDRTGEALVRGVLAGFGSIAPGPQPQPGSSLAFPQNRNSVTADPKTSAAPFIEPKPILSEAERAAASAWSQALASGLVAGTAAASITPQVVAGVAATLGGKSTAEGIDLLILPDPNIHDGRYANNGWLQELPKPITNLTWDNALLLSHATAAKLGVGQGTKFMGVIPMEGDADMVRITVNGRSLDVPVWVNLGQADDCAILYLGGGRSKGGQIAEVTDDDTKGGGFNAYTIRMSKSLTLVENADIKRVGSSYPLANTQMHNTIDASIVDSGRELIHEGTIAAYAAGDPFGHKAAAEAAAAAAHGAHHGGESGDGSMTMYDDKEFDFSATNYQWAMTVDLTLCTGCNACVTACQSENNIPVVGKYQVTKGREMHWIRVDRYYRGTGDTIDVNNPPISFQPVTCMQCENAPCEPVCPVAATVHSKEGINQMVYNRCVGTRYCSNNCPYKVRRFNFLNYANHHDVPVLKLLNNPDVSVRGRGVMEKCTFCVQRINAARIKSKIDNREIEDGEILTACQQACPSKAIIFGDKRKEGNAVAVSRADSRNYTLLEELNTRPRVTYLGRIRNPNPELEA